MLGIPINELLFMLTNAQSRGEDLCLMTVVAGKGFFVYFQFLTREVYGHAVVAPIFSS